MTPPRSAFGAPPQGGATCSPAEPVLRWLLDWTCGALRLPFALFGESRS